MKKPLRILYIGLNPPWRGGGTFYRAFGFARHLVRLGHDVTLLTTSSRARWRFGERVEDGVRLLLAPALLTGIFRSGWDPYEVLRRCWQLRERRFDLVHGFESRPVVIYPARYARRSSDATLVLDWCDWFGRGGHVEERPWWMRPWLRPVETFYEEHFRTEADGTTVINDFLRRKAIALGVPPETIHWLPNGAEVEGIEVIPRPMARREVGLPAEEILIGHLGQSYPADVELMMTALNRVQETRPEARLVLIGNHKIDLVRAGAGSAVISTGYVNAAQLNQYLAACDLLWLPLKDTGMNRGRWPMKVNDYMAAGRATVGTDVGDLDRLFRGERPIGVLSTDEPAEVAAATLALLADEKARQRYERNARRVAETEFDWKRLAAGLEAFYYRTLGGR